MTCYFYSDSSTFHNGCDIWVPLYTSIKAIASGKIIAVGKANGYGNVHNNSFDYCSCLFLVL